MLFSVLLQTRPGLILCRSDAQMLPQPAQCVTQSGGPHWKLHHEGLQAQPINGGILLQGWTDMLSHVQGRAQTGGKVWRSKQGAEKKEAVAVSVNCRFVSK